MEETDDRSAGRGQGKVARLISRYDLPESVGERLESAWTAGGARRKSLRTLADQFNRRLLSEAMADAGVSTVEGEAENFYRLLTDDEVSSGSRIEARRQLEERGVDVDGLTDDFVSYQAIRHYLTEVREAEYDDEPSDPVETTDERVSRLRSRLQSVTEDGLDRLRNSGALRLGEHRVFVDVDVLCEDCDAQYGVAELLRRGGCDCER